MSPVSVEAVRWTCERCGVSVGQMDGSSADLPSSWTSSDNLSYCLSCSRARAGEAAMELAPETISREDRVRIRRDAVIEFEIGRSPEAPDRAIATACRTSSTAVATVRGMLRSTASSDRAQGSGSF
jgi:hypothetical protein